MSLLLNFIDTGFIITLGILLLISGGIMLYCYRRLNLLENSVIEHGKILQSFIMNYNNQMMGASLGGQPMYSNNQVSNDENTENNYNDDNGDEDEDDNDNDLENDDNNVKILNLSSKIDISDDEDDDEDDEDDNEDDDEDDDDSYDAAANMDDDKLSIDDSSGSVSDDEETKIFKLDIAATAINLEDSNITELREEVQNEISEVMDSNENKFLHNMPLDIKDLNLNLNLNIDSKIINLQDDTMEQDLDKPTEEKRSYSKMKVDDLRSLVVEKNLTDNENAQKCKKSDLIKLLQN